ncbi:hypothetical protein [Natronorarus salvus]|uniref:hypothetical protein n=1 Tax=Natronorarus salvus TaxID=3117733 RepID=UPI002F2698C5
MVSWLPTRAADWRVTGRAVGLVLTIPMYAALAVVAGLVGLTTLVVAENVPLVRDLVISGPLPMDARFELFTSLYPFVGGMTDPLAEAILLVMSALIGINLAVLVYHLREHDVSLSGGSGSIGAVTLGALGAGCAACGSVLLMGVLGLFGATGLVALMPYDGYELTVLAVAALVLSTVWLAKGMRGGEIRGCPVDPR